MNRIALVLTTLTALASTGCSSTPAMRTTDASATGSVQVIPLQHIDAVSAVERLQREHGGAKIVAVSSTNSVAIAGSAAQIDAIRRAVSRMDIPG